jgi:hypothetical protein
MIISMKDGIISNGKTQLTNQSIDSTDFMLRFREPVPSMKLPSLV